MQSLMTQSHLFFPRARHSVLDQEGDALATALRNEGANAVFRHLDVTSAQEWQSAIDYVRRLHGKLDILVNNAGIAQRSGLLDASLGEWETVLRVNLTGPFIGIQTAVPLMGRGGSIINVSSIAGATGYRPSAYAASKWGLRGLTHSAALELVDRDSRQRDPPWPDRHTAPRQQDSVDRGADEAYPDAARWNVRGGCQVGSVLGF